jgi:DNA-binding XRE family transcriptional regulator
MKNYPKRRTKLMNLRQFYGFTQKDMGDLLYCHEQTYGKKERGERMFDQYEIERLQELLEVTYEEIF